MIQHSQNVKLYIAQSVRFSIYNYVDLNSGLRIHKKEPGEGGVNTWNLSTEEAKTQEDPLGLLASQPFLTREVQADGRG